MDNTLIWFWTEVNFYRELLGFVTIYYTTILGRCAIVSVPVILFILLLRKTILRNTVFLKGALWSLFLFVPFFGKLRAYYDFRTIKNYKWFTYPFLMCQEISISIAWIRAIFIIGIAASFAYLVKNMSDMKRLFRQAEPAYIGGVKVYASDMPVSPCAFGLLSPKIMISKEMKEDLSADELNLIIMHEQTHIRLGHLWIFFAWEILSSLLWINPLLRLSAGKLREDMEQICDRVTMQRSGYDNEDYGNLIIKSASYFSVASVRVPAMFTGDRDFSGIKDRFVKIRDYLPYKKKLVRSLSAVLFAGIAAVIFLIQSASYPKYEVLPDITVGDEYGRVYIDSDEMLESGAFIRCDDGRIMIDSKKLRDSLPKDFPRDKYIYFYYDIIMKIPGMGGGGECGWLSDVPESGEVYLTVGERNTRDKAAIWLMKSL